MHGASGSRGGGIQYDHGDGDVDIGADGDDGDDGSDDVANGGRVAAAWMASMAAERAHFSDLDRMLAEMEDALSTIHAAARNK